MKPNPANGLPPAYLSGYKEATRRYKKALEKQKKKIKELTAVTKTKALRPIPLGKPKKKGIWRKRMDKWARGEYHSRAEIEQNNSNAGSSKVLDKKASYLD